MIHSNSGIRTILLKCFSGGPHGDLHSVAVRDGQMFNGGFQSCLHSLL